MVTGTGTKTGTKSESSARILVCVFLPLMMLFMALACLSVRPDLHWHEWADQSKQYEKLAVSFGEGHVWLDDQVPDSLLRMEDPYNYGARSIKSAESGDAYPTDVALSNGHYYVYFGITPEILFFFPFRSLTGHSLPTWIAVLLCSEVFVAGAFALMKEMMRRYYPDLRETGLLLLLTTGLITGSGAVYLTSFPTTYSMPAICGLMLLVWGLYFWLRRHLIIGSILIALIAGCRPQIAAAVLLAFPIFADEIREGKFFRIKKESLTNTLKVIVPFIVIGCGVLYYNFLRFGSTLEFGYRYLLTIPEVGKQQLTAQRVGIGLFLELAEPLRMDRTYPFIHGITWTDAYQSVTYIEPFLGGFFVLNLIGFLSFLILRRKYRNKAVRIGRMSLVLALLMVIIDVTSAGISQRYLADYGVFFMIPALIVCLEILSGTENGKRRRWEILIAFLVLLSVVLNFGCVFSDGRYMAMKDTNPAVYEFVGRLFS